MTNLSLNFFNSPAGWFTSPVGFMRVNFRSMYNYLPLEKQREIFPKIVGKNVDDIINHLKKQDNDPIEKRRQLIVLLDKIFGKNVVAGFEEESDYGFEDYISDNPEHFIRTMRRLYNAVLDNTTHSPTMAIFFGHLANPDMKMPLEFLEKNSRFVVRHDLYEQIVDDEMTAKASRAGVQYLLPGTRRKIATATATR